METWAIILFILAILWLLMIFTWVIVEFVKGENVRFLGNGEFACDTLIIDGELFNYQYNKAVLHIEDSYKVSKKQFGSVLADIEEKHPDLLIWKRSKGSLKREWATHNMLFRWGWWKSRTKDVDLDYGMIFPIEMAYWVVGTIALLFIK